MRALQWARVVARALNVAHTAFVTWYLILSSLQEKWFSQDRKQKKKSLSAEVAIKDIMERDNDNKETFVIIENSSDGKLLFFTLER